MSGELAGGDSHLRMSDHDREQVVGRLYEAVGEGRITMDEFEDRLTGTLAARTFGDVVPYLADLPSTAPVSGAPQVDLVVTGSPIRRVGRWIAPPRMHIKARGSSVTLDYTEAIIASPVIQIDLAVNGSSLRLIVPRGSSADLTGLTLHGSSANSGRMSTIRSGGLHLVVRGEAHGSSVRVKSPWRWPWQRR
jgi:hypothetical protein